MVILLGFLLFQRYYRNQPKGKCSHEDKSHIRRFHQPHYPIHYKRNPVSTLLRIFIQNAKYFLYLLRNIIEIVSREWGRKCREKATVDSPVSNHPWGLAKVWSLMGDGHLQESNFTEFIWETKREFKKWLLMGDGCFRSFCSESQLYLHVGKNVLSFTCRSLEHYFLVFKIHSCALEDALVYLGTNGKTMIPSEMIYWE